MSAAQTRLALTNPADPFADRGPHSAGGALNNFGFQEQLSDPSYRVGPGPNVDTLYSLAWLDLAEGPFVLQTPDFGSRYYTFQMATADSATAQSLGLRTHGSQLPPVFVHGPDYRGKAPAGMVAAPSTTRYLLIAGRMLVQPDDPADFRAVHELQERVELRRYTDYQADKTPAANPVPEQRLLTDGPAPADPRLAFLQQFGNVLRDWEVAPGDRNLVNSFRKIGVTMTNGFRPDALTPKAQAEVARGLENGAAIVQRQSLTLGESADGWTTNSTGPRFGDDWLLRAGVAKDQIFVTLPEEALYPIGRTDSTGQALSGADGNAYRITFAADTLPPVEAFWSITLYDDTGFLVTNPIDRYANGDRTTGLVRKADGSIEILIGQSRPTDPEANWLPAPEAPFYLMMRLYTPRGPVLDGSWIPPEIVKVHPAA